jgi:hypothetical protein
MQTFLLTPLEDGLSSPHWRRSSLPPLPVRVVASATDDARGKVTRATMVLRATDHDSPLMPWMRPELVSCVIDDAQIPDDVILTSSGEAIYLDC